jgi:hypothetical protein
LYIGIEEGGSAPVDISNHRTWRNWH